jgi:hypothetical protein
MMTEHTLPELNEQNAPPGTPLKPYDLTIDRAAIERHCASTGEPPTNYEYEGRLRVPPGLLAGTYGRLIHDTFFYTTGVHVSSDLTLNRPVLVGEPLRVSGAITEHFERNGNTYVRFTIAVHDADGRPVAHVEHVSIYKLRPRATGVQHDV